MVEKAKYIETVVPAFQRLKFDFWGHDSVVLHGHEIRKATGDFNILLNPKTRASFIDRVTALIGEAEFTLIAAVIDKKKHVEKYSAPADPYSIALGFCMERLQRLLMEKNQAAKMTHLQVECRGRTEDARLELEFRRICDGANAVGKMPNLDIRFMDKKHNSTGLQLADLVAHPIGRHVIKPDQPNRAYDALKSKFRAAPNGKIEGYGLKVFP
ncbi:hypothetical protein M2222_009211 [Bradyrhizobium elkanii]|nr:hypothetical protein [Bradyrhizobium elkanii]MCS3566830.1 hypothetical protein [Bradyrhizobium elkanii]MCW2153970.1 hypothetical protein [Bradyrhizobium elkanii]MCW2380198.1 hypothetical protein [Bradyrhizobium elkanii]